MKLLKFEKQGCGPCTAVQNHLDSIGAEVTRIDAMDNPKESAKYEIGTLPTVILVDEEGNEVKRSIGFNPPELDEMADMLK